MNSSQLKGYLTGLMFGDGYIDKGVTKRSFAIKNINRDFIYKIYNDLSSCTPFDIQVQHIPAKNQNGCKHKEYWELRIKSNPYFAKKYHHFYDDNRKRIVSKEALDSLNAEGLAMWYMCDGYLCLVGKHSGRIRTRRIDICTDRYSIDTVQKFVRMLDMKFHIKSGIVKRGQFYRIRIYSESYETFFHIVYPHMCHSMMYKLYFDYEFKPSWMTDSMWSEQINLRSAIALPSNVGG